ncbi:MAG: YraN family protein [Clostridiaceae bacterium]|nr:YraN family protein [Clostridiaceae bacterium]
MVKHNKRLGEFGERQATKYYKKKRYKILTKNYYVKGGEIDIIVQKGEYIVFVEVKTRSASQFGNPAEAVTFYKRQRMIKAAKIYLQKHGECYVRFDVVEVFVTATGEKFKMEKLNHIENAFEVN